MSDLISRSKLIDYFYYGIDDKPIIDGISDRKIIDIIKNQPTAYSVDKVVAELEERTDFLKDCKKYGNKNAKQQDKSYSTMMMYEVADLVDDLIEIVKQGGVGKDDDMTIDEIQAELQEEIEGLKAGGRE